MCGSFLNVCCEIGAVSRVKDVRLAGNHHVGTPDLVGHVPNPNFQPSGHFPPVPEIAGGPLRRLLHFSHSLPQSSAPCTESQYH